MRHQPQKGFRGIFVGIPDNQQGYEVYIPATRQTIPSHDIVFDESFFSALSFTSRPYYEAMAMRPSVSYTPFATSSKEQTGNVITFAQFEEGNFGNFGDARDDTDDAHDESSKTIKSCQDLDDQ